MTISIGNGLPDIVSVQKRLYPLIFTHIVSEQPTSQPVATAFGFKSQTEADDGSGWKLLGFSLDRWFTNVKASKLKTEISIEAIQDLAALGMGDDIITTNLADSIADDINTDIITSLNAISQVGAPLTLLGATDGDKSWDLYTKVHVAAAALEKETGCHASYAVAGGDIFGMLTGSGYVSQIGDSSIYVSVAGLTIVHDKYSTTDYFTVGVKKDLGEFELSSLVFSPYNFDGEFDSGIAYQQLAIDPSSFNPTVGVIARYALTVAPLDSSQKGAVEIDWDNLGALANSSKLSVTYDVTV
ncbi:major capsid protein [Vibrio phage 1.081.O._10N.286.52.C2]|nr:major capsid protein [Vibrio phage 1.081.O._10N.286.52.C2]